jgi:RecA/RadA recombinase
MAKEAKSELDKLMESCSATTGNMIEQFNADLPVLSTGVFSIDMASGPIDPVYKNGGIRARDIWEVMGKPGQGKTSLAHSFIKTTQARYQHKGAVVGLFSEPPDIPRMRREGIDVEKMIFLGTYHKGADPKKLQAEKSLDSILKFVALDTTKAVIIDSVSTITTKGQEEKEIYESQPVAALAKIYNVFINDFSKTTVEAPILQISHFRQKVETGFAFGLGTGGTAEPETVGGRTKEFLSMVRMIATSTYKFKKKGSEYILHSQTGKRMQEGIDITYQMFRNKYANADNNRVCKAVFDFSKCRFNNEEQTLFYADHYTYRDSKGQLQSILDPPVISRGAWTYIGEKAFNGTGNAVKYLEENPGILLKLQSQIVPRAAEFFADVKTFNVSDELDGGEVLDESSSND